MTRTPGAAHGLGTAAAARTQRIRRRVDAGRVGAILRQGAHVDGGVAAAEVARVAGVALGDFGAVAVARASLVVARCEDAGPSRVARRRVARPHLDRVGDGARRVDVEVRIRDGVGALHLAAGGSSAGPRARGAAAKRGRRGVDAGSALHADARAPGARRPFRVRRAGLALRADATRTHGIRIRRGRGPRRIARSESDREEDRREPPQGGPFAESTPRAHGVYRAPFTPAATPTWSRGLAGPACARMGQTRIGGSRPSVREP